MATATNAILGKSRNVCRGFAYFIDSTKFQLEKPFPNCTRALSSIQVQPATKTTWTDEKRKYIQMPRHEKRKEYACGSNFITVDDVKTLEDFILTKVPVQKKSPMPTNFSINSRKNAALCRKIFVFSGDITTLEVDAIVNPTNSSLMSGGGVDEAIHKAAGPFLMAENHTHDECRVGEVKISGGYQLPARVVISTVGPRGERPELLRKCYKNSIDALVRMNLKSIAFPSISTGIYGYPMRPATHICAQEIRKALEACEDKIEKIVFCLLNDIDEATYAQVLPTYFPLK